MPDPSGYIKLFRKIWLDEIWQSKEAFDRRSAWIDLIMLANWKDGEDYSRKARKKIKVKRGEVWRSIEFLAARWNWSRGKVTRFLNRLENEHKAVHKTGSYGTLIIIENYELFQDQADIKTDINPIEKQTENRSRYKNKEEKKEESKSAHAEPPHVERIEPPLGSPEWYAQHYDD